MLYAVRVGATSDGRIRVTYRLPSLNALRAFEAAGRHISFTRAAAELHVTQAAISRHIFLLEESLKTRLFIRKPRHLELTDEARVYLEALQIGFKTIEDATKKLTGAAQGQALRVVALPALTACWLMPRLPSLARLHPDVVLHLDTANAPADLQRDQVDIALGACSPASPAIRSERILDIELLPVCHPLAVNGIEPPRSISDLQNYPLLNSVLPIDLWGYWAARAGLSDFKHDHLTVLPTSSHVYQAARDGLGIGMGVKCFVEQDLAQETLVAPFGEAIPFSEGFYMNILVSKLHLPQIAAFRRWILNEVSHSQPVTPIVNKSRRLPSARQTQQAEPGL